MKKVLLLALLVGTLSLFAQANGDMWEVDGKTFLRVWGTHYDRGYAQGYFLGDAFMDVFENYMFNYACYGNPSVYNQARSIFTNAFVIEEDYVTEASAMIDGAADAGTDVYFSALGRDLDGNDVLMANALIDLINFASLPEDLFACSSISSWGTSTEDDETLQGGLVITRFMDWSTNAALFRNPVVLIQKPEEEDEQNWISFTFPGLFGGLSAINENGLTTFLNMGNNHSCSDTGGFYPILLTLRNGIEKVDYDADGEQTTNDILQAVEDRNRAVGTLVHVTHDNDDLPIIIENNNQMGVATRSVEDNTVIQGDNLALTNHFRVLYNPITCYRYNGIVDSLEVSTVINDARSWNLLAGAAGISTNIHAIRYNSVTREVSFASAQASHPAYGEEATVFNLDEVITPSGVNDEVIDLMVSAPTAYPNPFNPQTTIRFSVAAQADVTLEIYNVKGQRVERRELGNMTQGVHQVTWNAESQASGVYLCRVSQKNGNGSVASTGKMLLLK